VQDNENGVIHLPTTFVDWHLYHACACWYKNTIIVILLLFPNLLSFTFKNGRIVHQQDEIYF